MAAEFQVNQPFSSEEEVQNLEFKMAAVVAILDFRSKLF